MPVPIDYATLRLIWWALLGVLLIGFAVFDGFDLGTAMLLPFVGRTNTDRRVLINSVGPVWEGNQVWFILGGGAAFAAWPPLYAISFSGFYIAMFIVLVALILRPVAFKFRGKVDNPLWRGIWDWALFLGGLVPSLIFGVAFGNLLQGVPFHFDDELRGVYTGGFFALLNPFAILCGLVSVMMLAAHGAAYLHMKTVGDIAARARRAGIATSLLTLILFAAAGLWIYAGIKGYALSQPMDHAGPSTLLRKTVEIAPGAWLDNYHAEPWTMAAPLLGLLGPLMTAVLLLARRPLSAFLASALGLHRHHRDAGARHVPVHAAVVRRAEREPDGVGRVGEPADIVHHAGGGGDLPADRSRLHGVGLPRAARQDHAGTVRNQPAGLLEHVPQKSLGPGEQIDVVFRLGARSRPRLCVCDFECDVARARPALRRERQRATAQS